MVRARKSVLDGDFSTQTRPLHPKGFENGKDGTGHPKKESMGQLIAEEEPAILLHGSAITVLTEACLGQRKADVGRLRRGPRPHVCYTSFAWVVRTRAGGRRLVIDPA